MGEPISIVLVDDHALIREALRYRLGQHPDLKVVDDVSCADDAILSVVQHQPDIVIMDIDMPGMLPFEAVGIIRQRCRETRLIFLSECASVFCIEQALECGAWGYLTKLESADRLISAIHAVRSGRPCFAPEVQARLVVDGDGVRLRPGSRTGMATLTPRELEVLRYIARGLSQKAVAEVMHLSPKTISFHMTSLMNKLDIHDRVRLARFAIREGLVQP